MRNFPLDSATAASSALPETRSGQPRLRHNSVRPGAKPPALMTSRSSRLWFASSAKPVSGPTTTETQGYHSDLRDFTALRSYSSGWAAIISSLATSNRASVPTLIDMPWRRYRNRGRGTSTEPQPFSRNLNHRSQSSFPESIDSP